MYHGSPREIDEGGERHDQNDQKKFVHRICKPETLSHTPKLAWNVRRNVGHMKRRGGGLARWRGEDKNFGGLVHCQRMNPSTQDRQHGLAKVLTTTPDPSYQGRGSP